MSKYGLPPPGSQRRGASVPAMGSQSRGQPRPALGSQTPSRTQGGYALPKPGSNAQKGYVGGDPTPDP
jgi:hypothetical protein